MNELTLKDPKVVKLLKEKEKIVTKGRELSKQIEKLETERNKLALQAQKIKDKIMPFAKMVKEKYLNRYNGIQSISLGKDGDIKIVSFDYIEEYKKVLEKQIKEGKL